MFQLQRGSHDRDPLIHFANAIVVAQTHIAQIGDVSAFVLQGMHRMYFNARQIHGSKKQRQARMLGRLRISAYQQKDIVRQIARRGEDFLTINQPLSIRGALGPGACGKYIRSTGRLAESQTSQGLARAKARQDSILKRLAAKTHGDLCYLIGDGRGDTLPAELFEYLLQGGHIEGSTTLAAVFLGPMGIEEPRTSQLAVEFGMKAVNRMMSMGL